MMIVDAVRSAPDEYAVYFLVTAYIESLRHFEHSAGVPAPVLQLPLAGPQDLATRLHLLKNNINVPLEAIVPASEIVAVLACAVARLGRFEAAARTRDPSLLRAA